MMTENTSKPFDGLKMVLFHLFEEEQVRVSSLKGITTATGEPDGGLVKDILNLLYGMFKSLVLLKLEVFIIEIGVSNIP